MPARLPTAVKAMRGTLRRGRVLAREPRAPVGAPRPSRDLPLDVRREFDKLVRRLAPLRVLTTVDGLALELGALALAETWRHELALREHGSVYETTTPAGSVMVRPRPEVALASDAWRRAAAMLREFGLTPSSRSRVEAAPAKSSSRWAGLLMSGGDGDVEDFRRRRPRLPRPAGPRRPA